MSVVLPIIIFTVLGDTINLRKYEKTGFNIYGQNYNTTVNIPASSTASYLVIKSSTDVPRFLGVDPRLSLGVKITPYRIRWGLSSFIRESSWRSLDKVVQILVKIEHIVTKETAPPNAEIDDRWKGRDPDFLSTHYVRGLIKGGQLVSSIVFRVNTSEQKEVIERAVEKHLGRSGNLTDDFEDRLNKIQEEIGDNMPHFSVESTTCASCNQPMSSLNQIIGFSKGFQNEYADNPVQVFMELDDLSNLINNYPSYFENSEVISVLEDLDEKLDDLATAEHEFRVWEESEMQTLSESQQNVISSFGEKMRRAKRRLAHAYFNLDFAPNSTVSQFNSRFYIVYGSRNNDHLYTNELRKLQQQIGSVALHEKGVAAASSLGPDNFSFQCPLAFIIFIIIYSVIPTANV